MLTVIDEYTRKCLDIKVASSLTSDDVLGILTDLFTSESLPNFICSDNGLEFTAGVIQCWRGTLDVKTAYITLGSPWKNCFNERFNGSLRDELLNGEVFYSLQEAKIIIEKWRNHYDHILPHSSLNYQPPQHLPQPFQKTIPTKYPNFKPWTNFWGRHILSAIAR